MGKILVVDDEKSILDIACRVLKGNGHEVATAGSGPEALQLADVQEFDLVLSDVRMPGMNGAEIVEVIKQKKPDIKIGFMSGHTGGIAIPEHHFFIQKPFSIGQLSAAVCAVFAQPEMKNQPMSG